jgi:signal transduction histidine kinase
MRKLLSVILLFAALSLSAQSSDELLQLVDSAYAEAMAGRLPEAIHINEEGLALVPPDSTGLQCEFYSCLLFCYHRLGDYERALHYGELCLSYDETQDDKSNLSASLGNLAGIYSSAGKHDVAIEYLNRAIRIEEELLETDPGHTAKSLAIRKAMLGEVLVAKSLGLPEAELKPLLAQALQLTKDAYLIDTELGRQAQVGMRLSQLGNIYKQLGDTEQARDCNEKALQIARETGNRTTEVITLLQLDRYREAIDLAHELGMRKQELEACRGLAQQCKEAGQYAEATTLLERAAELNEAISTEATERQLTMWQVRYDTQQKEQRLQLQAQTIRAQKLRHRWLVALVVAVVLALVLLALYVRLLQRRKREMEETAKAKDRYYTILSHDLRNPMMAQQQVLQMLYKTTQGETQASIGKLLSNNSSQLELLGNLQELAMLQLGKRKIQPTRLDLGALVTETVSTMRATSDLKGITLTTQVQRTLVSADRETIRTVLRNLISNAIKFSHQGGTIEIGTQSNSFFVRDHGVGMSAKRVEELSSIAKSSKKNILSESGTLGEHGTGIGLPLCMELVSLNKGQLHIESEPEQGTTITVTLPNSEIEP